MNIKRQQEAVSGALNKAAALISLRQELADYAEQTGPATYALLATHLNSVGTLNPIGKPFTAHSVKYWCGSLGVSLGERRGKFKNTKTTAGEQL